MKKNVFKKIFIIVFTLSLVFALFVGLTACNDKFAWSNLATGMNNVKLMTCKIVMKDKDVIVVDYTKIVEIDGTNALLTEVENKLGDDFQPQTDESSKKIENIDKASLLPLNLSSSVLSTLKKSKTDGLDVYASELEEIFIKQVMNTEFSFGIYGTATLKIKCKGNDVQEITLDYVTKTGRVVSAIYSYVY